VEERGLNRYQVGKIYFAQELNRYLESPLEIGDSYALVDIDGITTIVPKRVVDRGVEYIKSGYILNNSKKWGFDRLGFPFFLNYSF